MDCRQALALLDAGRPDRSDWDAPELAAAAQHVDRCPECQARLVSRQQWDAQLAEACAAVPMPSGLTDRLLAALEAPQPVADKPGRSSGSPVRSSRRRWGWVTAAAVGFVALGWMSWQLRPSNTQPIPLVDLYQQVDQQLLAHRDGQDSPPFAGDFDALPSDPVWREAVGRQPPIGLDWDGQAGSDAAAYRFSAGRLAGWLIVVPRSRLQNPPSEALPVHANFQYGEHPRVAWTTGEQVYVCVLDAGHSLDELRRTFYGSAA